VSEAVAAPTFLLPERTVSVTMQSPAGMVSGMLKGTLRDSISPGRSWILIDLEYTAPVAPETLMATVNVSGRVEQLSSVLETTTVVPGLAVAGVIVKFELTLAQGCA